MGALTRFLTSAKTSWTTGSRRSPQTGAPFALAGNRGVRDGPVRRPALFRRIRQGRSVARRVPQRRRDLGVAGLRLRRRRARRENALPHRSEGIRRSCRARPPRRRTARSGLRRRNGRPRGGAFRAGARRCGADCARRRSATSPRRDLEGVRVYLTGAEGFEVDIAAVFDADFTFSSPPSSSSPLWPPITYRSPRLWIVLLVVIGLARRTRGIVARQSCCQRRRHPARCVDHGHSLRTRLIRSWSMPPWRPWSRLSRSVQTATR